MADTEDSALTQAREFIAALDMIRDQLTPADRRYLNKWQNFIKQPDAADRINSARLRWLRETSEVYEKVYPSTICFLLFALMRSQRKPSMLGVWTCLLP